MASYLSDVSQLATVSRLGVALLYPGMLDRSAAARARMQVSSHTLRRNQIVLDSAFLLYTRWRDLDQVSGSGGAIRFVFADSSPQAGRDWFQCKEHILYQRDIVQLSRSIDALATTRTHMAEAAAQPAHRE